MRQTKSAGKIMMIIFLHHKDVIYHHAVPAKTIVNSEYYASFEKIFHNTYQESIMNW